ncbi:MAG: aminoacyl-tRNA hydrolase [Spirochaetaceae bacterium]|jgi:PTH1 family peptidyl-tRNA hydrolase|nr:aminoacyl-tRNA hydrolase [Spirochaetaceae bacterium]
MQKFDMLVFLGNPGSVYAKNRHNAGRFLAERFSFPLYWTNKFKGLFSSLPGGAFTSEFVAETEAPYLDRLSVAPAPRLSGAIYFLEPETFMNLSGQSVQAAAAFYKISPEHILVVHDELELPLGQAAFKFSGGLGGHNGLRSIKASLGTADFWRLRIGIGRPAGDKASADISSWVLSNFSPDELPVLDRVLTTCAAALEKAIVLGPADLLPEWNKKKIA